MAPESPLQATEADCLLLSPIMPSSDRTFCGQKDAARSLPTFRGQLGAGALMLAFLVYSINSTTTTSPRAAILQPPYPKRSSDTARREDDESTCTGRVLIMRHCEKEAEAHEKKSPTDALGNRHCNAKGSQRAQYISTLFVDLERDDGQGLAGRNSSAQVDGALPVPLVAPTSHGVGRAAAGGNPLFPPPAKLYALSSRRPARKKLKKRKHHKHNKVKMKKRQNFREIDTLTPLADKFHLDIDASFGPNEEDDLVSEYFANLNKTIQDVIGPTMRASNATSSDPTNATTAGHGASLCVNGMTIVSWKHSRIPLLARAFGCGKKQGCPKRYKGRDFDTMWMLTFRRARYNKKKKAKTHKKPKKNARYWDVRGELVSQGFGYI